MAPYNRFDGYEFTRFPSLLISVSTCVCILASMLICACCCKKRREKAKAEEEARALEKKTPLVVGGLGTRFQQVTTTFAINVFKVIMSPTLTGARAPSCLFSPYALQTSFAVTMLGAHAATQTEMTKTLFPESGTTTYAEDVLKEMIESTKTCRQASFFRVFVRVYAPSSLKYSSEFRRTVEIDYNFATQSKPFTPIDFAKPPDQTAKTTHQWLSTMTRGQLTQFASTSWRPVSAKQSRLCVVSAATIDCEWTTPFNRHRTKAKTPFYFREGKSTPIDMMRQLNTFGYYDDEQMQILRMEYQKSDMVLYVFLPRLLAGLEQLEKKMTPDVLLAACGAASKRKQLLEVSLPKFKMECEIGDSLVIALANAGLATAFKKGAADFSHILDDSVEDRNALWVSGAVHKAAVEFADREGSKTDGEGSSVTVSVNRTASAASSISSIAGGSTKGGVDTFLADHPFMFLIVVEPKMTPIFFGRFCGT